MRHTGVQLVTAKVDLGSDSANPASVGINDTASDGDALGKTELVGSLLAEGANTVASTGEYAVLEKLDVSQRT